MKNLLNIFQLKKGTNEKDKWNGRNGKDQKIPCLGVNTWWKKHYRNLISERGKKLNITSNRT